MSNSGDESPGGPLGRTDGENATGATNKVVKFARGFFDCGAGGFDGWWVGSVVALCVACGKGREGQVVAIGVGVEECGVVRDCGGELRDSASCLRIGRRHGYNWSEREDRCVYIICATLEG